MKKFLKCINFKASLLYFVLMQLKVVLLSTFISSILPIFTRFLFPEVNLARDVAEIVSFLVVELIINFLIYFSLFKNSRNLTFKQFSIDYSIVILLRYLVSMIFSFALYVAGPATSLLGITITELLFPTNNKIVVMQDVPKLLYTVIFILIEFLMISSAYCAYKISSKKREKLKKELLNEK